MSYIQSGECDFSALEVNFIAFQTSVVGFSLLQSVDVASTRMSHCCNGEHFSVISLLM